MIDSNMTTYSSSDKRNQAYICIASARDPFLYCSYCDVLEPSGKEALVL